MTLTAQITTLIDKHDNFEIVRDRLVEILLVESAAQQVLAAAADPTPKDPDQWKLRVFSEASDPWEQFLPVDAPDEAMPAFVVPIVNVWFDSESLQPGRSTANTQVFDGTFHLDCYGYGISQETDTGHVPGDTAAVGEAQRAARIVRNIIMAGQYFTLGFPTKAQQFVWGRRVDAVDAFFPGMSEKRGFHVCAMRVTVHVEFSEFAPEYQPVLLEELNIQIRRTAEGEVFLEYQVGESPEPEPEPEP